jgi:hypothetical protein
MILGHPHFLDTSIQPDLTINRLGCPTPGPLALGTGRLWRPAEGNIGGGQDAPQKWMDDEWDDEWNIS